MASYRVSLPEKSLVAFKEDDAFKLFIDDIGLLNYMLKIRPADILEMRLCKMESLKRVLNLKNYKITSVNEVKEGNKLIKVIFGYK